MGHVDLWHRHVGYIKRPIRGQRWLHIKYMTWTIGIPLKLDGILKVYEEYGGRSTTELHHLRAVRRSDGIERAREDSTRNKTRDMKNDKDGVRKWNDIGAVGCPPSKRGLIKMARDWRHMGMDGDCGLVAPKDNRWRHTANNAGYMGDMSDMSDLSDYRLFHFYSILGLSIVVELLTIAIRATICSQYGHFQTANCIFCIRVDRYILVRAQVHVDRDRQSKRPKNMGSSCRRGHRTTGKATKGEDHLPKWGTISRQLSLPTRLDSNDLESVAISGLIKHGTCSLLAQKA